MIFIKNQKILNQDRLHRNLDRALALGKVQGAAVLHVEAYRKLQQDRHTSYVYKYVYWARNVTRQLATK